MQRALSTLSDREQAILRLRLGIAGDGELTLEQVGRRFSLTRERIRQIQAKAIQTLRLEARSLRCWLEE